MKLKKVYVEKLFDVFNHEIKFNEQGITIIIGENGLGKTVILEMIDCFFNSDYQYFESIEFKKLEFDFEDDVRWIISKDNNSINISEYRLDNLFKELETVSIKFMTKEEALRYAISIAENIPFLIRKSRALWINTKTMESLDSYEVVKKYGKREYVNDIEVDESLLNKSDNESNWFKSRIENINVSLIKTQRLLLEEKKGNSYETIKTVDKYSNELSNEIKKILSKSTELSSKLDRTYPKRLIESIRFNKNIINEDQILDKLKELEKKREMLSDVGLMDIEEEADILKTDDLNSDIIKDVMMQYIVDSFDKLEPFDEIAQKIKLLLDIINNRFKHKKLYIDREIGFNFRSTVIKDENNKFKYIPVDKLSSGEQNELVLFYELIFKTDKNSLILIDEPEISLHISWQNYFIKDIKNINEINNLEVLIATHSPDLIGNYWDLNVSLKGVE